MDTIRTTASLAAVVAAIALLASACGGSGDPGAAAPSTGSAAAGTVSVQTIDGVGDVLVDSAGAALYAADQEANGNIVCTQSCTTIWDPLTLGSAKTPTGASRLGTIVRPDGGRQVTFEGRPLYRFLEDPDTGTVTGNGFADSFDGRAFTWHVATSDGISMTSSNSSTSTPGY